MVKMSFLKQSLPENHLYKKQEGGICYIPCYKPDQLDWEHWHNIKIQLYCLPAVLPDSFFLPLNELRILFYT